MVMVLICYHRLNGMRPLHRDQIIWFDLIKSFFVKRQIKTSLWTVSLFHWILEFFYGIGETETVLTHSKISFCLSYNFFVYIYLILIVNELFGILFKAKLQCMFCFLIAKQLNCANSNLTYNFWSNQSGIASYRRTQ